MSCFCRIVCLFLIIQKIINILLTNLLIHAILCPVIGNIVSDYNARVAQLVERDLAKVEAAGSSPVSRLKNTPSFLDGVFF